jgi:hemolysin D
VQGQYLELRAALDQSDAQIEQREAEIRSIRASITALSKTLPISRELAADYRGLLDKQFVAKHAYLEKEQILLDQERELAQQKARISELKAALKAAQQQRTGVLAQTRRAMLDLQNDADVRAAGLTQELRKAEQRNRLTQLTAPVDGTVQQLAIHTQGGVVTQAQPLMVIVPSDQAVEVDAKLENKDVGFVRPGQAVEVKIETFNFTKYGVIDGTVVSVSSDAIEDEKFGLVYSVRIQLNKNMILVGENLIALSPGMAVTAELKTDKRKVIDYFLSPLKQHAAESLDER